jgi:CheY-like chemotaxis protein
MATLLVAEDHPDVLAMLALIFQSEGYKVVTAQDGVEAVAAVERHSPDLVLMDLWMPAMDGVAATKRIRMLPGKEHLPIIAVTAHPAGLKGDAHLFNHVCVKPCGPTELIKIIRNVITGR